MADLFKQLAAEAARDLSTTPNDKNMARLRNMAQAMVDKASAIAKLEEQLEQANVSYNQLASEDMPSLMTELGVDKFGLASANVDLIMQAYYKANIAADWPPEQREAAFSELERVNGQDLIKNIVTFQFGRGDHNLVRAFIDAISNLDFEAGVIPDPTVEMTVPWNSLTAFVRERVEAGNPPNLEKLGATVGTIVKIKPRKATK